MRFLKFFPVKPQDSQRFSVSPIRFFDLAVSSRIPDVERCF